MTQLKGVAIGAGYFSQFHFEAWSRINDIDLVAVCDVDENAAAKVSEKYGVPKVYSDVVQMLETEKPDFVDIITRPDSHLELTRAAVERGIAVICQKPLAPDFAQSKELVESAQQANVRLMVHENFRFQPWYREIKKLLEDRSIGDRLHTLSVRTRTGDGWQEDAYLARQPYFRDMPKFLIFETGVHFIDTFRFLAGEVDGVFASLRTLNRDIAGEDAGTVLFEFVEGAKGIWDANRFNESASENPRYTFGEGLVEGNGGSIRWDAKGRITIQRLGESEQEHAYDKPETNFAGDCVFATQKHFVEKMLDGAPFETSGTEYLKTLAVQEAVYESARTGLPVRGLGGKESDNANH